MTDELIHYGIRGQKWGIRRFQNSDGSLTPEGRKRYAKEINEANKEAFKRGAQATRYGRAGIYAANRAAAYERRAERKLEKDPNAEKKSTQRSIKNMEAAERAAIKLAQDYAKYRKEAEDHCKQLIDKYGAENVKNISYKDVKVSKEASKRSGRDKFNVVNENVNNLTDWAIAGASTVASFAVSAALKLPVVMIYSPSGKSEQGLQIANQEFYKELSKDRS